MRHFLRHALVTSGVAGLLLTSGTAARATAPDDPYIPSVCGDRRPSEPGPGTYGMQLDGTFRHPWLTPASEERHAFPGGAQDLFPKTKGYDPRSYTEGPIRIEAAYRGADFTPDYFHTWQNVVDFDGRRYLFQYDRSEARVYDVTDVRKVRIVERLSRSDVKVPYGENVELHKGKDWAAHDYWGASTIQWSAKLKAYVMVQSFEQKRQVGELGDAPERTKFNNPEGVAALRAQKSFKGFKVYRLDGPRKKDWKLLSTVTTDASAADPLNAPVTGPQQGSGSLDAPYWTGGRYMFVAVAPLDTWSNTEVPTYLYSAGYQAYDMSDPASPRKVGEWHRKGQVADESAAYARNPRCGNQTSWMGARMPLFVPTPIEEGGRYGFAALGGFGLSVLDISDPSKMREVAHLDLPMSVGGTEADNVDVSQFEKTGMVYVSGYPLGEDCREPYKDVFQIDVRDPRSPRIVGALPRPRPAAGAKFADYCQRGGSFGPKRSGSYTSPGDPKAGLLPYAFYNAGVQFFDTRDVRHPKIAAQFVPAGFSANVPDYALGNQTHAVYTEWDRKIVWVFTNDGIYAVSSRTLLGAPNLGRPAAPFRTSAR
ncbi:hypothetical protein [Planomonospora venezuelensis]|uniref:LVIVD repeat-containing protein n=1 Tax=Planomonospora venezuelensis TaxID=1999 RepID=A0A841D3W9_PLAVE|nr:hypothetical protein [Planomonospora venezuelensis]MBB5963653.1 hypothetical protein [Planomonospora venezuelensis]GIN01441.1 hypothetical protein Pve01_30990 [Planomonospora venezuelensis]